MTFKFAATMPNGQSYIVRFYPPDRSYVLHFEPELLRRCRVAGLKVPEVITDSRDDHETDWSYVVYGKLEGNALSTGSLDLPRSQRARLFGDIRYTLEGLSAIAIEGFGELHNAFRARRASLSEFVESSIERTLAVVNDDSFFSQDVMSALNCVRSEFERLSTARRGIVVWADLGPENILVDEHGHLAGLLDFEGAFGGTELADIGYCYARYAGTKFRQFLLQELDGGLDGEARSQINLFAILRGIRLLRFRSVGLPVGGTRMPIFELLPGFRRALRAVMLRDFAAL